MTDYESALLSMIAAAEPAHVPQLKKLRRAITKRLRELEPAQPKNGAAVVAYSERSMQYAQYLEAAVKSRYPFYKQINLEQWATDIYKITRLDGYQFGLVGAVLKWSQQDPFWRQQIRSGANLRKHFQTLLVRMNEEQGQRRVATI